jgi:hypothetical protein
MRSESSYRGARRNAVRKTGIRAWRLAGLKQIVHKVWRWVDGEKKKKKHVQRIQAVHPTYLAAIDKRQPM